MNECLCFARDALKQEPEQYRWEGSTLWGLWPVCPAHGERFISPVWTRRLGRIEAEAETVDVVSASV